MAASQSELLSSLGTKWLVEDITPPERTRRRDITTIYRVDSVLETAFTRRFLLLLQAKNEHYTNTAFLSHVLTAWESSLSQNHVLLVNEQYSIPGYPGFTIRIVRVSDSIDPD